MERQMSLSYESGVTECMLGPWLAQQTVVVLPVLYYSSYTHKHHQHVNLCLHTNSFNGTSYLIERKLLY